MQSNIAPALTAAFLCLSQAAAQPAESINLGQIGLNQTVLSEDTPIASGGVVWYRFELTSPITPHSSWLDIDTAGPTVINDPEVALYDWRGNRLGQDDDSGGGGPKAAMSFGAGSGDRLSGNEEWGGGRISDGAWGQTLPEGVYYIAISGWDAVFPNPQTVSPWVVTTNSTDSGVVRVEISTGTVAPGYWNERNQGGGTGWLPQTAQPIEGTGSLTTIVSSFAIGWRDMFRIRICDPDHFTVTAINTEAGGANVSWRARLFLLDTDGRGVAAILNAVEHTETVLSTPPGLVAGEYFLAVSSHCGGTGGTQAVPYSAAGQNLWDFADPVNHTVTIPPNGPGAADPMAYWGWQSNCELAAGNFYTVALTLTGACRIEGPTPCPADFDQNGTRDVPDVFAFLSAWFSGCP